MNQLTLIAAVAIAALTMGAFGGYRYASGQAAKAQLEAVEEARKQERETLDNDIKELNRRLAQSGALAAQAAAERDAGNLRVETLQAAVSRLRGQLTKREEVTENGQTVVTVRRSTAYGVCVRAAIAGDTTGIADCQAGGVPLAVPSQ